MVAITTVTIMRVVIEKEIALIIVHPGGCRHEDLMSHFAVSLLQCCLLLLNDFVFMLLLVFAL